MAAAQAERQEELKRRTAKLKEEHKKRSAKRPEEPAASDPKQASAGPCMTTACVFASAASFVWHMTRPRGGPCMLSCRACGLYALPDTASLLNSSPIIWIITTDRVPATPCQSLF